MEVKSIKYNELMQVYLAQVVFFFDSITKTVGLLSSLNI